MLQTTTTTSCPIEEEVDVGFFQEKCKKVRQWPGGEGGKFTKARQRRLRDRFVKHLWSTLGSLCIWMYTVHASRIWTIRETSTACLVVEDVEFFCNPCWRVKEAWFTIADSFSSDNAKVSSKQEATTSLEYSTGPGEGTMLQLKFFLCDFPSSLASSAHKRKY